MGAVLGLHELELHRHFPAGRAPGDANALAAVRQRLAPAGAGGRARGGATRVIAQWQGFHRGEQAGHFRVLRNRHGASCLRDKSIAPGPPVIRVTLIPPRLLELPEAQIVTDVRIQMVRGNAEAVHPGKDRHEVGFAAGHLAGPPGSSGAGFPAPIPG
jgi:hypothetical protein